MGWNMRPGRSRNKGNAGPPRPSPNPHSPSRQVAAGPASARPAVGEHHRRSPRYSQDLPPGNGQDFLRQPKRLLSFVENEASEDPLSPVLVTESLDVTGIRRPKSMT